MRHDLVRDACGAGEVQSGVCQDVDLFTKPLDIKKCHRHAKLVLNVV